MRFWIVPISIILCLEACVVDVEQKQALKQSTPQEAVRSFFGALNANDLEAVKKILAPERRTRIASSEHFNAWLNIWRQCDVIRFIDVLKQTSSEYYEETVYVKVEYKCVHRPNFVNSISVSRIGNVWYWDEN